MSESLAAWGRLKGETAKAFQAFTDYCLMGLGRSLRKLHERYCQQAADGSGIEPPTKRFSTLGGWSSKFDWPQRAAAWDAHQRERDRQRWTERQSELREQEWAAAQHLLDRAREMLEWPLKRERVEDDGQTVIIEPTSWSIRDAERFVKTASELARLSAEMLPPVQRHAVEITKTEPISFVRVGRPASEETDGEPDSDDD